MSFRDGTGPLGMGSGTGRGKGYCSGFAEPGSVSRIRNLEKVTTESESK